MISIITPTTTGGLSYLATLMPTIMMQEVDKEFILIDNDSRDGTTNFMSGYDCTIKINKMKMNFSESNNYGASLAKGDYLMFLNNDTKLEKGLLQEMLNTFNEDEKIGIVGARLVLMIPPYKTHHAGVMFTENYEPYELGLSLPFGVPELPQDDPRLKSTREVPSVTAACMMVKREVFEKVGGFDPNYIFGWEDTDFVLKAREFGYKVWYTGKNFAYHKHFGGKDRGRFKYEQQNRARYEEVWMKTKRAENVLKGFKNG